MSIKLTRHEGATLILIGGDLTGEAVGLLNDQCAHAHAPIVLDLVDLRSADEHGLEEIRRLQKTGVRLVNVSPLIELRLKRRA